MICVSKQKIYIKEYLEDNIVNCFIIPSSTAFHSKPSSSGSKSANGSRKVIIYDSETSSKRKNKIHFGSAQYTQIWVDSSLALRITK